MPNDPHLRTLYAQLLATIAIEAPDLLSAVHDSFVGAAETLHETDYADACPIATVALKVASTNETLRLATADVFTESIDRAVSTSPCRYLPCARARTCLRDALVARGRVHLLSCAALDRADEGCRGGGGGGGPEAHKVENGAEPGV